MWAPMYQRKHQKVVFTDTIMIKYPIWFRILPEMPAATRSAVLTLSLSAELVQTHIAPA